MFAHRAGRIVDGDDVVTAQYRALDYFPTPPWAARAIGHFIREVDPDARTCWEPACGEGHMAHGLSEAFARVRASDIHPHGYGEVIDFMMPWAGEGESADWIVTNPPFSSDWGSAAAFASLAWGRARRGVALLCRSQFEETVGRYALFHGPEGATFKVVFAERVAMTLGRWEPRASTASSYSLFVWLKPPLRDAYPQAPLWRGFPPGTRARFERESDQQFARPA